MEKKKKQKKLEKSKSPISSAKKSPKNNNNTEVSPKLTNEELKSLPVTDNYWQCIVVILVFQNQKLHDLLHSFKNLPENCTVVTRDTLQKMIEGKRDHKGAKNKHSTRASSKGSNKTKKIRSPSPKSVKKEKRTSKNAEQEIQNHDTDDTNCIKTCLALKQFILDLKHLNTTKNNSNGRLKQSSLRDNKSKHGETADVLDQNRNKSSKEENTAKSFTGNKKTKKTKNISSKSKKRKEGSEIENTILKHNSERKSTSDIPELDEENKHITYRNIILWGFYETEMPELLIKYNIPLQCMMYVKDSCIIDISNKFNNSEINTNENTTNDIGDETNTNYRNNTYYSEINKNNHTSVHDTDTSDHLNYNNRPTNETIEVDTNDYVGRGAGTGENEASRASTIERETNIYATISDKTNHHDETISIISNNDSVNVNDNVITPTRIDNSGDLTNVVGLNESKLNVTDYNTNNNVENTKYNKRLNNEKNKGESKYSSKNKNKSSIDKVNPDYDQFYHAFNKNLDNTTYLETIKDTIIFNYTMSYTNKEESSNQFQWNLLEVLNSIRFAWEKYIKYNESIKIYDVPTDEGFKLEEANLYWAMISMIPLESVSIPIILHCMLEQITWWNSQPVETIPQQEWSTDLTSTNEINNTKHLESQINGSDTKGSLFDIKMTKAITIPTNKNYGKSGNLNFESEINNLTPILIDERNKIKRNTFHLNLPEFDFENIAKNMYITSPVFRLWHNYPPQPQPRSKWYDFQLKKLQSCFENDYLNSEKLYLINLHQSFMNILVSKVGFYLTKEEDNKGVTESHQSIWKTTPISVDTTTSTERYKTVIEESLTTSALSTGLKRREKEGSDVDNYENEISSLQTIKKYQEKKLNKLKSFFSCPEFCNYYREILSLEQEGMFQDHLNSYEFIEELNSYTMCQSLQEAFHSFINLDFDYFPPTDSLMIWFNNITDNHTGKVKSNIETYLGFRDFYKHKLKLETNLMETKELKETTSFLSGVQHYNTKKADGGHLSDVCPTIAYNLGPLWLECDESFEHLHSLDGSQICVTKRYDFLSKTNIKVDVNKNNMQISYSFYPDITEKCLNVLIHKLDVISISCCLTWKEPKELSETEEKSKSSKDETTSLKEDFHSNVEQSESVRESMFEIECDLSITLPSGLLVEVVPTDTSLGPFYIRQRYLAKGPACNNIWDEEFRCYFNNGTIIIFYVHGTVNILYNNGTTVKCKKFDLIELNIFEDLENIKNVRVTIENPDVNDSKRDQNGEGDSTNGIEGKKSGLTHQTKTLKSGKNKLSPKSKKENKIKKKSKPELKREEISQMVEEYNLTPKECENNLNTFMISEHSLTSWDGQYKEYVDGIITHEKYKGFEYAFDCINHELYIHQKDGISSLVCPESHTVLFPDGSKTTSYATDSNRYPSNSFTGGKHSSEDRMQGTLLRNISSVICEDNFDSDNITSSSEEESQDFVFVETKYVLEHNCYATVIYENEFQEAELIFPPNIKIKIDKNRLFQIKYNNYDKIVLSNNLLVFEAHVIENCLQKCKTKLHFKNIGSKPTITCKTIDSFGNVLSVDEEGNSNIIVERESEKRISTSIYQRYPENVERLFVLNRNLTGYEMIHKLQQEKVSVYQNVEEPEEILQIPLTKDNNDLFSLYKQTSIKKTRAEEYLLDYKNNKPLPRLLKKKDLLKIKERPSVIWFYQDLFTVQECETNKVSRSYKMPQAVSIVKRLKIKTSNYDTHTQFSKALQKYMNLNEQFCNKYLKNYTIDTRKEEVYKTGERIKKNQFGSKSYYLSDHLSPGILESVKDKSKCEVISIFSCTSKHVSVE